MGPRGRRLDAGRRGAVRYVARKNHWVLYWRDRNGRWHEYDEISPAPTFEELLAEVERDPTGIFWG